MLTCRKLSIYPAVLFCALLISSVSMAALIKVPGDASTIQGGINIAVGGDTVQVAAGVYEEAINFGGRSIVLISEDGPEVTTIAASDGSYTYPLPEDFDTLNSGMTGEDYRELVESNSSPPVVLMDNCDNNTVLAGFTIDGRDLVRCIYGVNSSPVVRDCIVENGSGSWDGGGMWFQYAAPLLENNIVRNNYTPISGGGIFISLGYGYGTAYIIGNTCHGNMSGNGPAISLIRGDDAIVMRNVAYNNTAVGTSEVRGAIYFWGTNIQAVNNTMDNNTAGFTYLNSFDSDVRNNIMTNNIEYGLQVRSYVGPNVNVMVDYNDIWNTSPGPDYNAEAVPGIHDISVDPLYGVDYSLTAASPCIDAGDPNPIYNDPDGSRNDMGAIPYEQLQTATLIIDPDTMYAFEAYPIEGISEEAFLYLGGDFEPDYDIYDIVLETILINGTVEAISTQIVAHPEMSGDVLKVAFDKADFVLTYGVLWNITNPDFSISADFTDDNSFVEEGKVTMVGHRSGDANSDGIVNIFDITYIVSYLYLSGPSPEPPELADANHDNVNDIFDITFLIACIYLNSQEPDCPE